VPSSGACRTWASQGSATSESAADEATARAVVERLAAELLANPLIESYAIALIGAVAPAGPEGGA
jgi:hypothetical protein